MLSSTASIGRASRLDTPFIAVCLVAVTATVFAFLQHQKAIHLADMLTTANDQSQQLRGQIAQLSTELRRESTQLTAEAKPDLPITMGFRPAILGQGLVMELRNNSGSDIEVAAVFSSDVTGQNQRRNLVLPANRILSFGSNEGWAFEPGQHVSLSNTSYRPGTWVVPSMRQ